MATATKRLNFMIRSELAKEFEAIVPVGMRSRIINEALSKELTRIKKQLVTDKLNALRSKMPPVSNKEMLAVLRADRNRDSK